MKEIPGLPFLLGSYKIKKEVASMHSHGLFRYDLRVWESPALAQSHGDFNPFFLSRTFIANKCFGVH